MNLGTEARAPVLGCCWLPSWAATPAEAWGPAFRPDLTDRELGFAAALGFGSVRVWLSPEAWEADPVDFCGRLGATMEVAAHHGLTVLPILFDSCGLPSSPGPGRPFGAYWASIRSRPDTAGPSHSVDQLYAGRPHPADVDRHIEVAADADPMVAVWKTWTPGPAPDRLGPEDWPVWAGYVNAVADVIGDHPALEAVEVCNEPYQGLGGRPPTAVDAFLRWATRAVTTALPGADVVIGAEDPGQHATLESAAGTAMTRLSTHPYARDGDGLAAALTTASAAAGGRRVLASEWGSFPGLHDEAQAELYAAQLPVVLAAGVDAYLFHLIAGYHPFPLSALLHPNGTSRPAGRVVEDLLTGR